MKNQDNKTTNTTTPTTVTKPKFVQTRFMPKSDGAYKDKNNGSSKFSSKPKYVPDEPKYASHMVLRRFVCRTNAGGVIRRMNIITALGDPKTHQIGIGSGTGHTFQVAAKQAEVNATNNLQHIKILSLKNNTIRTVEQPTIFEGYGIKLIIKQVKKPNLICANKTIRAICNLIGINAITVKVIGKTAALQNQVYAFIDAISKIESPRDVSMRLNKPIEEILERNKIYRSA